MKVTESQLHGKMHVWTIALHQMVYSLYYLPNRQKVMKVFFIAVQDNTGLGVFTYFAFNYKVSSHPKLAPG